MEFLNYRSIKAKLKKRGLLFKKPSFEDASGQFYLLARQLDDHKLYSGFCHLAITNCQSKQNREQGSNNPANSTNNNINIYSNNNRGQVGSLLNAARAFSQASYEVISLEDHIKTVIWIYTEALLQCDRSFHRPICLEMGKFYESHKMYQQAANCFKQSMSISRCVHNLILSKRYKNALDELKNCPSHLMTTKDHTSMFLLELLLNEDINEINRNSLQHLSLSSRAATSKGLLPTDDQLFDLNGLLESLLIYRQDIWKYHDDASTQPTPKRKDLKIKESIVDKLSAFLDPAQIQVLNLISAKC